jgi:3'-phosphoadenosine 5'-phosphosulfate sulfotransferase (PAPS reductase)/FAD synthetase
MYKTRLIKEKWLKKPENIPSRTACKTTTLLDAIEEFKFDACIGGARRDEEKPEPKSVYFRCVMILVNGTKKTAS